MQVEILGSGGANTIPRPLCRCRVCMRARTHGGKDVRTGPSVFVHGPDVLIDTPEESKLQVDRARITHVAAALYSHWHPDHTQGRRVWESLNGDWRTWPRELRRVEATPVYLTRTVAADFERWLGLAEHFAFMQEVQGTVEVRVVPDDAPIELPDGVRVNPIRLAEDYVFAFLFERDDARVLIAPDELNGWQPDGLGPIDLAVLPLGIFELDPFTGARGIHAEHPVLAHEATYPETLEIVRALGARRTVLSHVEHSDGLTHDDLVRLGERDGWEPAFDGLLLDL
jgi:phosphoribosyl 1,2-cyclic phosphate phosphodiesterase